MIQPKLKHDALLADIQSVRHDKIGTLHVWWLGQSGFLCQCEGRHLLFDPYLSDSLTRKYAQTDKPHVRMTELTIDPGRLDFIDVVTSSHNHTDHLDGETLKALFQSNPDLALALPEANRELAAKRLNHDGAKFVGFAEGDTKEVNGFAFTAIPAAHEERTPAFLGFVVRIGPWTVYHSGDTLMFPELVEALRRHPIDLAFLPINGRKPERRVAGNLDGREAAELAHAIGARMVVPCHYDMFTFNTETPALFVETCESQGQAYRVLQCGERLALGALDREV